jgi:type III secretory pathway lipoprotein EscJ
MLSQSNEKNNRHYLLILLVLGACLLTACGRKTVATAGNEFEANQMFDILYSSGFQVEKDRTTGENQVWNIVIDEGWFGGGEAAAAIQVLRDYGLPRQPDSQPKDQGGFGMPTEREEKERQTRELQIQVERQLYTLPDVIRASVIIAQPTNDILSIEKTLPTASVTIVLKETEPKFTTETVQGLVSGAVPNLKPGNVQVAFSKQALREIPIKELQNQRRSNAIFAIGGGIILLLAGALGTVWYITKRRRRIENSEPAQLPEENLDELTEAERLALNAENEE